MLQDFLIYGLCALIAFVVKKLFFEKNWAYRTSIVAGIFALVLSEEVFAVYDRSSLNQTYLQYLLCILFASFPLSKTNLDLKTLKEYRPLIKYNVFQHLFQWGGGLLVSSLVLSYFFATEDFLGVIYPAGFAGGHGSSVVVGSLFERLGVEYIFSLAIAMATLGSFFSLFGGMSWLFKHNKVNDSPKENKLTFSLRSIFIFTLICILSAVIQKAVFSLMAFKVPLLVLGLIIATCLRYFAGIHIKDDILNSISSVTTGTLILISLASLELNILGEYLYVLICLCAFGVISSVLFFKFIGLKKLGFNQSIFTWGWSLGGIVYAVSLLDIASANDKQKRELPVIYLLTSPLEIILYLSAPALLVSGHAISLGLLLSFLCLIVFLWLLTSPQVIENKDV